MTKRPASEVMGKDFESIMIGEADFVAAPAEGTSIESGEVREVLRAEVEEDGQLTSYDMIRLGGRLDPTGNSAKGKIFVDLRDSNDSKVDQRTEIRFVSRPKNGNKRTPLTGWLTQRDLDRDDPRQRMPLQPVTADDGDPLIVKAGRILAVEVRNGATSFEVDQGNSNFTVPAQAGY